MQIIILFFLSGHNDTFAVKKEFDRELLPLVLNFFNNSNSLNCLYFFYSCNKRWALTQSSELLKGQYCRRYKDKKGGQKVINTVKKTEMFYPHVTEGNTKVSKAESYQKVPQWHQSIPSCKAIAENVYKK